MNQREIKFRAWDKLETVMGRVTGIDYPIPELKGHHKDIRVHYWTDKQRGWTSLGGDYVLMQYTGLKDKNGVECYEGDVILSPGDFKWEVKWAGQGWEPSCLDEFEVIGNIYENPELLHYGFFNQ